MGRAQVRESARARAQVSGGAAIEEHDTESATMSLCGWQSAVVTQEGQKDKRVLSRQLMGPDCK